MSTTAIVLLNVTLDAAVVGLLAFVMRTPFRRAFGAPAAVVEFPRLAEPARLAA
jgi:hypothetical protein